MVFAKEVYSSFVDSGVVRVGELPSHWSFKPLFYTGVSIKTGREDVNIQTEDGEYPFFTCGRAPKRASQFSFDCEALLIAGNGEVGYTNYYKGKFEAYQRVYVVTALKAWEPGFLRYFVANYLIGDLQDKSIGSVIQFITLGDLRHFKVPMPPLEEQKSIARFLDHETAKIDELIAKPERLIELLKEKVVSLTLTPYQPGAAVEVRMSSVVDLVNRPVLQNPEEEYVPLGLYNRGRGLFHKEPRRMSEMGDSDFYWVKEGDLIISGQFAWEGAVALAGSSEDGCVVSHRYPVLRGSQGKACTEYIYSLLLTKHGDFLLNENSRGAAGRNRPLNIQSLLKQNIPLPPMGIQESVAKAVHAWRKASDKGQVKIRLLRERRTALISAAVTGKINVRNWKPAESQ
ncbi:MAG: restriction endonuclease subunit S [Pseudomonadota bacterium]|nr:restriction endonuclease subunit S [Pseudomonadota bacterium]